MRFLGEVGIVALVGQDFCEKVDQFFVQCAWFCDAIRFEPFGDYARKLRMLSKELLDDSSVKERVGVVVEVVSEVDIVGAIAIATRQRVCGKVSFGRGIL